MQAVLPDPMAFKTSIGYMLPSFSIHNTFMGCKITWLQGRQSLHGMEKHVLHGNYYPDEMQVFMTLTLKAANKLQQTTF